jgi:DNA-binding CsgD family transcriptional regulator
MSDRALSERERQVAALVAGGATNVEIAEALGIAEATVEWNLTRIYRKVGVRSRTELAVAVARGFPWAEEPPQMRRRNLVERRTAGHAGAEDDT